MEMQYESAPKYAHLDTLRVLYAAQEQHEWVELHQVFSSYGTFWPVPHSHQYMYILVRSQRRTTNHYIVLKHSSDTIIGDDDKLRRAPVSSGIAFHTDQMFSCHAPQKLTLWRTLLKRELLRVQVISPYQEYLRSCVQIGNERFCLIQRPLRSLN